jgi:hypothetical protein
MPRSNSYDGVPHSESRTRSTLSYRSKSQRRGTKRSRERSRERSITLPRPPKIRRSGPESLVKLSASPSRSAKRAANMLVDFMDSPNTVPGSVLSDFSSNSQREQEKSVSPNFFGIRKSSLPTLYSASPSIGSRHSRLSQNRSRSRKSRSPVKFM